MSGWKKLKVLVVYGPNILPKAGVDTFNYFDQRTSAAFDKVLELAHTNDVYLRPVVIDLNDEVLASIGNDGNPTTRKCCQYIYGSSTQSPLAASGLLALSSRPAGVIPPISNRGNYSMKVIPAMPLIPIWLMNSVKYMHCSVFGNPVTGSTCSTYENSTTRQPNSHLVSTSNWTEYTPTFWNACPNS